MTFLPKHIPLPNFSDEVQERFWSFVDVTAGATACWPWRGATSSGGYGVFRCGAPFNAHRVAYFLGHAHDPGAKEVCHSCDNPACCNWRHLFVGSHTDNMADKVGKGRARGRYSKSHGNRTNDKTQDDAQNN